MSSVCRDRLTNIAWRNAVHNGSMHAGLGYRAMYDSNRIRMSQNHNTRIRSRKKVVSQKIKGIKYSRTTR